MAIPQVLTADAAACDTSDFVVRAGLAADVAAANARAVDAQGRFPSEAFAALRKHRLLGIMVPQDLGGEGATVSQVADVCYVLGRACGSTSMIYAMHQTKVACLVRHGRGHAWHERMMRRLCAEQLLLGSSTTEGQAGGNIRQSAAPVGREGSRISLERSATCISYGEQSDAIVTTARRAADAAASDQVLVVFLKDDYALEPIVSWDTLGMRGTCSYGFTLRARGADDQILPEPYESIHMRTMVPFAHMMWSATWAGIAAGAVERARMFARNAARAANGQSPPGTAHLTRAIASLRMLRSTVGSAIKKFEAASIDRGDFESMDFQTAITVLKVNASELAVSTVMSALQATGLSGYRNDSDFSVGRHLRDVLSSPIMINNDRVLANLAGASLVSEVPSVLMD